MKNMATPKDSVLKISIGLKQSKTSELPKENG
jgi:hypothetical protein